MLKVLLTGGSGFVGRNVTEYFAEDKRIMIDAPGSKELNCIEEEEVYQRLKKGGYDVVLHFAGYAPSESKPDRDANKILEYNLRIFHNFAKHPDLYRRMFYTGSGAEYDKRYDIVSVKETDIGRSIPIDQYGLEKYTIGRLIDSSENIYNLRIFGLFGPYELWERRFISNMCYRAITNQNFVMNQEVFFDYLWIKDFVRIIERFLFAEEIKYHTYNVTSGERSSLYELAKMIKKLSGAGGEIMISNPGLGKEYTASNERLKEQFPDLIFTPKEEAIRELYEWYRIHQEEIFKA